MSNHFKTIVGDRPTWYEGLKRFPRGIEILMKKAKVDGHFQELVLQDTYAAARSIDLDLNENERRILACTSKSVLQTMIQNTYVPKQQIKTFLTKRAPAMLALVLASTIALTGGGTKGITAEEMIEYEIENSTEKMAIIQNALAHYRDDHGGYPSTAQWLEATNPLAGYMETTVLFDPWKRKFHYQGVKDAVGTVIGYRLESLGSDTEDPKDNIPCPFEPDSHSFGGTD